MAPGSVTAANWSRANSTPVGSLTPSGRSIPCSSSTRWTTGRSTRPERPASSGPPSQTAAAPFLMRMSPSDSLSVAPRLQASSAQRQRRPDEPPRASSELAHTPWCNRSPSKSRSADHSHGWRPVMASAGGISGSSSPIPGVSSITTERRCRQAAPSRSASSRFTAVTRTRSQEDHSPGATSFGPTTTDRPRDIGSGIP